MSFSLLKKSGAFSAAFFLACGVFIVRARAQTTAPMLGEIAGDDISVLGPSNIVEDSAAREIAFGGGSVIVVHSGKARVEFAGGGELEICGPAKFTVLASGEALTVALSFGRVHVRVDAARPITIYTPMIVATPMAIGDQSRDATIGLMNTGAMCVLAARGAVQVQQQLSGETLVLPQPSEVLLQGTSIGAARPASGSCRCDFDESRAQTPASQAAIVVQRQASHELTPSQPEPSPQQDVGKTSRAAGADSVALRTPAPTQPTVAKKDEATEQATSHSATSALPPAKQPVAKIDLPPIGYDAKSATAPAEPISVATLLLAKEVVVQPQWIFRGWVAGPPRTKPYRVAAAQQQTPEIVVKKQSKKRTTKKGFWAKLHDFFSGSPGKSDCVGEGCG